MDPQQPESPEPPTLVALRWDGELLLLDGFAHLETDDSGTHFSLRLVDDALGEEVRLDLHDDAGGTTATLEIARETGHLYDAPDFGVLTVQSNGQVHEIPGLDLTLSFPLLGAVRRMRNVFVGFPQDTELIAAVAQALRPDELPDAELPWTLASATRYAANVLPTYPGIVGVEVEGPGVLQVERDESTARIDLSNVFHEVTGVSVEDGRALLDRFLQRMARAEARDTDRSQLMLRVYPGPTPFTIEAQPGIRVPFASIAVAADLTAVFVQDTPETMRPLKPDELDALEPDPAARLALARENLAREHPRIHVRGEGPIYMLIAGGNYESSLPLLPLLWKALEPLLDGPPLVAVPARDLCFITGDAGPERRAQLAALCGNLDELAYAISDGIYRVVDRGERLERIE